MRLKKLSLINWRSLSAAKMPLSNVNFIFGKNNEGKSSIIYGAEYALTNGTSISNDLLTFQKDGTNECGTYVELDEVGSISRYRKTANQINRLNNSPVPDKDISATLEKAFGLDYDTISIMFDSSKFTQMDKKSQKAFLLRLTGIALNAEKIIEYMDAPKLPAQEYVRNEIGDKVLTIDDLESVYNSFYKARKEKNKTFKEVKSTLEVQQKALPQDKPREMQYIKEDLDKIVVALKEIEKTITIYNERMTQKKKLEEVIQKGDENWKIMTDKLNPSIPHEKKDIENIEKDIQNALSEKSALDKEFGILSSSISSISKVLSSYGITVDIDELMSDETLELVEDVATINSENTMLLNEKSTNSQELGSLETNIKNAKGMIEKLSTTKCPLSAAIECNYDKKPMLAEIEKNIQDWNKASETLKKRNTEIDDIVIRNNKILLKKSKNDFIVVENKTKELSEKIEKLNANKKAIEGQIKIVEWMESAKVGLDARKEELANLQIPSIDGLMEKKKEYEEKQAMFLEEQKIAEKYLKDVAAIKDSEKRKDGLQLEVDLLEYLVKEFAPNGVRSRILQKIIAPIQNISNQRLAILSKGYSLEFNFDKDFDILVTNKTGTFPFEQLSISEKLRIQIIIQDAVNCLKNVGIMVIDEVGLLDDENFISLLDLIKEIAPSYGNIFIVGTKDKENVVKVSEHLYNTADDVSVFYLENNEVFKL